MNEFLRDLAFNSFIIQWIVLSIMGVLCLLRRQLNTWQIWQSMLFVYLLVLFISLGIAELSWWILYGRADISGAIQYFSFMLRVVLISAIISLVALRYLYVRYQCDRQTELANVAKQQVLQSRIYPHFLFNCLNTIASLIHQSPKQAEKAVEDLAGLFRFSLIERPMALYQITEEWSVCEHYLRLEKYRLGKRLNVDWQIDPVPKDALIPPLILQPLLENSVYHGIESLVEGGTVKIIGLFDQQHIQIIFESPMPESQVLRGSGGHHQAQRNIHGRLRHVFGKNAGLYITQEDQIYRAEVRMIYLK